MSALIEGDSYTGPMLGAGTMGAHRTGAEYPGHPGPLLNLWMLPNVFLDVP